MKIVVKHVDNLKSSYNAEKEMVPEYLVYLMTEDNVPISCEQCYGDEAKDTAVMLHRVDYQWHPSDYQEYGYNRPEEIIDDDGCVHFTLRVEEVSYKQFKNNVLRNTSTYGN